MSTHSNASRTTVPQIRSRKGNEKIVCLTAYSAPTASLLDPMVDVLLVGDSVGMVVHGLPNTIGVTLDMMIMHGKAVVRGSSQALVVVDMPFGSYEKSKEQAYDNAVRVLQETDCSAIKLEANESTARTVKFLVQRGIPVMGHIGLRPQSVNTDGGFKVKGKLESEWEPILLQARQLSDAGAFAVVVEGVVEELARQLTEAIPVPTIGIGASKECDGQILVVDDMLGLFEWTPKFVRRYGNMRENIQEAVALYASDVRSGIFPGPVECYRS